MTKETLEEVAESKYGTDMDSHRGGPVYDLNADSKRAFVKGAKSDAARDYWYAKWQQEIIYSKEDMKQFAFECVANFLSNDDNKVEIKLVDVIIDRVNNKFEQFKKGRKD